METIRKTEHVREQYATSSNLTARISIHEKYSVNQMGFGNWIYAQYDFPESCRILELGCGNGAMWMGKTLPRGASLTLTDFSDGMLETARANLAGMAGVEFRQADIQAIPFDDASFDFVIANMMLYHVPDLDRAIAEVRRVLRDGGGFTCATTGENGIAEFVWDMFAEEYHLAPVRVPFTLQNGGEMLARQFESVEVRRYEDHLEVTDASDLVGYIRTLGSMADFSAVPDDVMLRAFEERMQNGVLVVPKEYGMFLAR